MIRWLLTFLLLIGGKGVAQLPNAQQLQVNYCLQQIALLQKDIPAGMAVGLLPTFRVSGVSGSQPKVDNSAFFTGWVVNILRQYLPNFNEENRQLAQQIIDQSLPAIGKFKHWQGKPTYFYWPADTLAYFPNSFFGVIAPKERYLPDDADASVILLQAAARPDSVMAAAHQYFQQFVGNDSFVANSTLPAYKNVGAYSTWLGRGMPVDFDVCVLANILHFVDDNQLAWKNADSASAGLILQVVNKREYLSEAAFMAPHYAHPSVLIFHFAKWMTVDKKGWLLPWREQLINDANQLLGNSQSPLEILLLKSAILQMGGKPISRPIQFSTEDLAQDDFAFFRANIAAYLPARMRKTLDHWQAISFRFYCPAFNYAILLQYLVLTTLSTTP